MVNERLRRARTSRGEELPDLAARTGLREGVLRAIEDGRYNFFPGDLRTGRDPLVFGGGRAGSRGDARRVRAGAARGCRTDQRDRAIARHPHRAGGADRDDRFDRADGCGGEARLETRGGRRGGRRRGRRTAAGRDCARPRRDGGAAHDARWRRCAGVRGDGIDSRVELLRVVRRQRIDGWREGARAGPAIGRARPDDAAVGGPPRAALRDRRSAFRRGSGTWIGAAFRSRECHDAHAECRAGALND